MSILDTIVYLKYLIINRQGEVGLVCNHSTLGGQSGPITGGQKFKTSLANMVKPHLY